jgi:hypothetical protein
VLAAGCEAEVGCEVEDDCAFWLLAGWVFEWHPSHVSMESAISAAKGRILRTKFIVPAP